MDSCFGTKAGAGLCHYMPDATGGGHGGIISKNYFFMNFLPFWMTIPL